MQKKSAVFILFMQLLSYNLLSAMVRDESAPLPEMFINKSLLMRLFANEGTYFVRPVNPLPKDVKGVPGDVLNIISNYVLVDIESRRISMGACDDAVSGILKSKDSYAVKKAKIQALLKLKPYNFDALRMPYELSLLAEMVLYGDKDSVSILIELGAQVNLDAWFRCPLPIAVRTWQADIVQLLIEAHADVNKADAARQCPLHLAAQAGQADIAWLLIQAQADVNSANNCDETSLIIAVKNNEIDVVKMLIKARADLEKASNLGMTPLIMAARRGHVSVARLLLEAESDVDKVDDFEQTPLFCAAATGHTEVVRLLIEAGADVHRPDDGGVTPLKVASDRGHADIVTLLQGS